MELVLFDLDNTLVDRAAAFAEAAAGFAHDHGLDPREVVPFLVEADRDGLAGWRVWLRAARDRYGLDDDIEVLARAHEERYDVAFRPDPAVRAALVELRRSGRLVGVVTNGPPRQTRKLTRCGLDDLVDGVCVSEAEGIAKPDGRVFERAAQRCGVPLEDVSWVVGDSPEADVGGARAIGARSVWIHRGRPWPAPLPPPTDVAGDVPEAVRLILAVS